MEICQKYVVAVALRREIREYFVYLWLSMLNKIL
jgi:hypothetical protein